LTAPTPAPRKVLFVIPGLRQGGAERQLLELMRRLPARFESSLCVFDGEGVHYGSELPAGQPRHVLGLRRMTPAGLRRLARVIEDERPDILHSYRDRSNLWTRVALAAHGVRVPVVITSVRNRNLDPLNVLSEDLLLDGTDRIVTNSAGIRRELVERVRIPGDRIDVIPNFIDLGKFHPAGDEAHAAARTRWSLAQGELALLLPGRLSIQKHQLGLLVALWQLKRERRLPPEVRVLLAGRARDVIYSRAARALVRLFGLEAQVRFLGAVTDMVSLYHAADAVLLPSLWEGMPNAVIEAHACGLPVLASRAANEDDLVADGETGLEVPTADADALAAAIARLCALTPEQRREMGARGRERVTRMLDPEVILARIVDLYDRLSSAKDARSRSSPSSPSSPSLSPSAGRGSG
jgi:glycosyltransferase involved in cell wall biosynthesis